MVVRPVVTLGASIARDCVDAVALRGGSGKLTDRVLAHRVADLGPSAAGVPELIESLLDGLAAEVAADYEIAGAAVTYRDAAGRRAVVTGLAAGPWREASLVSAKSAHLALARAMTWAREFEYLLVCEPLPGYQGFSLISPLRDRVVAATATNAGFVSEDSVRPGIAAAWDQFDAAGVRPSAVVVIGSAADRPAVAATLSSGFNVPVIPCSVAAAGSAIGAALVVQPEAFAAGPTEAARMSRNSVAVVAAASVLAGGLTLGGIHELTDHPRSDATTRLADARTAAQATRGPRHAKPDPGLPAPDSIPEFPIDGPMDNRPPRHAAPDDATSADPAAASWGPDGSPWLSLRGSDQAGEPKRLAKEAPEPDSAHPQTKSVIPAPTEPVGGPDASLLFPGESAPPQLGAPEFNQWWDNHWRLTVRWMVAMMPRD
ncbi:hypothetical protein [Nocardia veterana]|uniref:DUF7159 domain-containing protein n=1 Tax=Nocardia veterana TaxID=132249 RepID=A0A7X6RIZ0_9NOCA|nr:hypothetical protein [Nocardia veterana]NKY87143.1 hypothetical protein [Nocardia veterana]